MPQIEARSWWDDVQHLRPDAPAAPPAPLRLAEAEVAPAPAPARSRRVLLVTDDEPRHAPVATARVSRRAVELLEPLEDDADDLAPRRAARRRPAHAEARPSGDLDFDFGRSASDRARRRTEARRQAPPAGTSIELTLSSSRELEPAAVAATPALAPLAQRAQALLPARRERAERPARAERAPRPTITARMLATPEHFALYAVVLGILLVIVAASSGR